jgi:hypothetical protein
MANMTRYLQKKLGDAVVGGVSYTLPSGLWLSLHDAAIDDAGSFADELSTSGTGYGRVDIRDSMEEFDLSTGIARNDALIQIGPALTDWGVIRGIGLSDAETGGNMLFWSAPTSSKLIIAGQPFEIHVHKLIIRLN